MQTKLRRVAPGSPYRELRKSFAMQLLSSLTSRNSGAKSDPGDGCLPASTLSRTRAPRLRQPWKAFSGDAPYPSNWLPWALQELNLDGGCTSGAGVRFVTER